MSPRQTAGDTGQQQKSPLVEGELESFCAKRAEAGTPVGHTGTPRPAWDAQRVSFE